MLIEKGLFRYHGLGNCASFCDLEIYTRSFTNMGEKALVFIVENPSNSGTSVTNSSETIASIVYQKYLKPRGLKPEDIYWAECCNDVTHEVPNELWDNITYDWEGTVPVKPHWKSVDSGYIKNLRMSFLEEDNA